MVGDVAVRCVMCDAKILVTFHRLLAKDVIGVAKTGSGKTLGYLLPGPGDIFWIPGYLSCCEQLQISWKIACLKEHDYSGLSIASADFRCLPPQYDWMTFSVFNCYRAYCISAIPKYSLDRRVILRWIHRWRIALQVTSKWNAMNKKVCETCRVSTVVISSMDEIHRFQVVSIHGSSQVMTLTHLKIVDVCFCRWQCLNKMGTKFQLSYKQTPKISYFPGFIGETQSSFPSKVPQSMACKTPPQVL